jgi:hypothetical protein
MRWYRTCLLEGRSPFVCPEVQYPVGAPLGHFSPLQLQALAYLPLSLVTRNDVLIYNLLWLGAYGLTGLGTFALAYRLTAGRAGAALAGVLAMLAAPMSLHACGHLELITLGTFPLFLLAWMGFVDRPTGGRLLVAALAYLAVVASAAYYAVLAVFPAALHVGWEGVAAWRRGERGWLRARVAPLAGFAVLAGALALLACACQVWSVLHGDPLARSRDEFDRYGAPLWGYLVPTWAHRLHAYLPVAPYEAAWGPSWANTAGERASYLGLVTLGLLLVGAARRVRFPRSGYLWAALGLVVLLSLGSSATIAGRPVPLPAGWLYEVVPPLRFIRVPARFNLLAAVLAAVLAGAAFADLVRRLPGGVAARGAALAVALALAWLDLHVPFTPTFLPPMPPAYAAIVREDPDASFLELPQDPSIGTRQNALTGYWQGLHRGRTSGGYSGHGNRALDRRLTFGAPFLAGRLADPAYLADPENQPLDLMGRVRPRDYAWLYLHAHGFRYAVLHRWPGAQADGEAAGIRRLETLLAPALIREDELTLVYDRDRLPVPQAPAIVLANGWGVPGPWRDRPARAVGTVAGAVVYNPDAATELIFAAEAAAFRAPRAVRVLADGREVARWTVAPDAPALYLTPPFRLPAGRSRLELRSDGAVRPRSREAPPDGDRTPIALRITGVDFRPATPTDPRPPLDRAASPTVR